MELHIVLVEPEIPQNTGNIARTCAALRASLHLIHPLGFSLEDKYLKRAGLDYWPQVAVTDYQSLDEYHARYGPRETWFLTTKARQNYCDPQYGREVTLVFGKETQGLPESLLRQNLNRCIRIPMYAEARSLNLSNAAAIAGYEVLRQWGFDGLVSRGRMG